MEDVKPGTPLPTLRIVDRRDVTESFWIVGDHPGAGEVSIAEVRSGCDEATELFGPDERVAAYIVHACNNYAALEAKLERMEKALGWRDTDTLPTEDDAFVLGCDYDLFNPFVAHRFEGEWWYEGRRVDLICWMPCPARYTPQDLRRFNEAKSAITASTTENGG